MTTAEDGGKVVSLTHRPPLTPGNEVQREINFQWTNVWKQEPEIKKHITYLPFLWSTFPIQHTTTKIFLDDDSDYVSSFVVWSPFYYIAVHDSCLVVIWKAFPEIKWV